MRLILTLALAASLSACVPFARPSSPAGTAAGVETPIAADFSQALGRADAAVARAETAYARIRGKVDLVLPFLPDGVADPIRRARAIADQALVTLRVAVTVSQRRAALADLERAARALIATTR